jgi:hypothetical protein
MKPEWKKIGVVGVDSGTLMIADPCYVDGEGWTEKDYDKEVCGMKGQYSQVKFELGHPGKAVIFSSGLGDGVYDVFAKIEEVEGCGKRITEVKIVLI